MTTADVLPPSVLRRRAVVYVRQSSQSQVQTNLESNGGSTTWSRSRGSTASTTSR